MRQWRSASEEDTLAVGESLAAELLPDGALLLEGPLGSGKTVLTQGVARGLGFARSEIQSPTYTLIHEYQRADVRFVHVDLYRLEPEQMEALEVRILDQLGFDNPYQDQATLQTTE